MRPLFVFFALVACAPTEPLPTACDPACPNGQVCINAQCLVAADSGSDAAPDVLGVDVAVDVAPSIDTPPTPDVTAADVTPEATVDAPAPDVARDAAPSCTDTQSDPANCGACGHRCNGVARCYRGACECASDGTVMQTMCGPTCVDLTQNENCGGCGGRCPEGSTCTRASPIWHCVRP